MHENGKSRSSVEIFCLRVRKKIVGTTSKVQNVWDLEKYFAYHSFPSIFLSHSTEKLLEEPSNVSESFKYEVSKKFMRKNRISRLSVESFFGSECRKISVWNTSVYQKSSANEKFHAYEVDITFLR